MRTESRKCKKRQTGKQTQSIRDAAWRALRSRFILAANFGCWHVGENLGAMDRRDLINLMRRDYAAGRFKLENIMESSLLYIEDYTVPSELVVAPTDVQPGSQGKIEILAARVAAGAESLHVSGDLGYVKKKEDFSKKTPSLINQRD